MPARWAAASFAVLLGLAAAAGAVRVMRQGMSPAAVASRFFHAVADADAPLALGLAAAAPAGQPASRAFLTSAVLRQQRDVARMADIRVGPVTSTAPGRSTAEVRYRLDFATGPEQVIDQAQLIRRGRSWRLTRVSVAASIQVTGAPGRITLAGRPLPPTAQLFPGPAPVAPDWTGIAITNHPYLRLADPATPVTVAAAVDPAGRAQLATAIDAGLARCLEPASSDPNCPVPTVSPGRPVPGTLYGRLAGSATPAVTVRADGLLTATATVTVRGSCQVWDYDNIARTRNGGFSVAVTAYGSVADPAAVVFGRG